MLAQLGYRTLSWNGADAPLVVIGRNALKDNPAVAARLEPYVRAGGRALICAQDPDWLTRALGWRVCPKVVRRVFPIPSATRIPHSALPIPHSEDLRDWTGSSTLIEAYPEYVGNYLRGNEREQPYAGWHWGNRGGVSSAAIEKPHRSGWRPLLECEFDLGYTPLMELDYGKGRLIVCTLDLEDHLVQDPAARRLAGRILDSNGQYLSVTSIVVQHLAGFEQRPDYELYTRTYEEKNLLGQAPWQESFALGDLQPGWYRISFAQNGIQQRTIQILPGQLAVVTFQIGGK
jgi:hypothetical protein